MKNYRFDVVIVGGGPAGVTAAGALSGSGISVALIETAVYAGAENWSGCVYFAENLAADDCFGHAAVENAPYERRVVRRGTFVHNGIDMVGVALSDPAAFANCYTVLRPLYDPYFANLAREKGVVLITDTTVLSLIRKDGRVVGVQTDRGPLAAGVVFIAEGDASHLVAAERLERNPDPHYLQGVKAVLSLPTREIDRRFGLGGTDGAAYEYLVRNPTIGGRTAALNLGAFLYTNRDSLSLGYVVPLENLRKHGRGDHGRLFEWMRGLPSISELTDGAALTSYGTKIIRSGGWRDRPVLIADGLAVGGATACLGIDIPFPNFTGPASATGLYFARAVKALLANGRPFDAKHLDEAYLAPLMDSVYGRNARALSLWPGYFSRSTVLFGRTADVICGSARFLATGSLLDTARFLRGQALSLRALRELVMDTLRTVSSLGLGRHLLATLLHPATLVSWIANAFRREQAADPRLTLIMIIGGKAADATSLPWPLGGLIRRISPLLIRSLGEVYANDDRPMDGKLRRAVRRTLRSLSISDLVVLPLYGVALALIAAGTAVWDAIRYYIGRVPAAKLLAEPVMAFREALRKARDLDSVKPAVAVEAKLALNTYRTGSMPHIRALWPAGAERHPDTARSSLWWVCPARVYAYDAPLAGRGRITVNWENCIKCESCWRAEPTGVLWGRFTDHRLIYRPVSGALPVLLASLKDHAATLPLKTAAANTDTLPEAPELVHVRNAAAAFREAIAQLPAAADAGRLSWPAALGTRLTEKLAALEGLLRSGGHAGPAAELKFDRDALGLRIREGTLYHALYAVSRIEQRLRPAGADAPTPEAAAVRPAAITAEEISRLFPDRVVKQWEETPMPEEWAVKLRDVVRAHRDDGSGLVRSLASVSAALGLIAGHQLRGLAIMESAGRDTGAGACAVDAEGLSITASPDGAAIRGTLSLVPLAASTAIAVVSGSKAYLLPLDSPGITVTATPAIGFRAAGLAEAACDCIVPAKDIVTLTEDPVPRSALYLAVALGSLEYLSRRAKEHALGRVQFSGQMLDTEGRDGIAKLGSVKALIARVEAWRLLLETAYNSALRAQHPAIAPDAHSAIRDPNSALSLLCSSLSALAFGPEAGCPAYDAGQVFGGFAYSEDDLLSRSYRDSSLFRFLEPGLGAAERLTDALAGMPLERACSRELGVLDAANGTPLDALVARWRVAAAAWAALPAATDRTLSGEAAAVLLGIRGLIAGIGERLGAGRSPEQESASVEVLLGIADDMIGKAAVSAGRGTVSPSATFPSAPVIPRVPLDLEYEDFCTRPGSPHRSGLFLRTVFDRSPRYVPEMQLHDFWLRIRWISLVDWFKQNCRDRDPGGLPFERLVEQAHSLPPDILAEVRKKKWLATYVPQQLDGLGWRKADYYVLNSAAGSFGDASLCLLIMASTSIGTTPVMLGLEDEIPRARRELEPLAGDPSRLAEIGKRLDRIIASFDHPDPGRIRQDFTALMALVESRLRRTSVVKYLSANFLRAFYGAGSAGQRGDFSRFLAGLRQAERLFRSIAPDVQAALDELPRRERSHRLFLQRLGHGGVSAFALTEPTAGSDSGGVRTTARLDKAALTPLPDGRLSFFLGSDDAADQRFLIDADRVVFTPAGMAYRAPDNEICLIRGERFPRSYAWQGRDREFHDIAQVRRTPDGPSYEFYRLTGAKMWITNASVATQFSLFAQTTEGVTGFMVDRFSEGLVVGADESKMGQRGSPTNEISLDTVRVPREAVIGFEGHGQVNALETLNVGRCGLAVVAGSLMRKLMDEARRDVPASARRDSLLGEAAAVLFGSESLAYYLVGLFDRPHESVRMESAIAKQVCSEDLHEFLTLIEQAYGPAGQTEKYLLEKARRDSRILNIYEGTNEVQRFLILKDLVAQAADWPELPERLEERPADEAGRTLARWKNRLRRHVRVAAGLFGDTAWSDAMLQPALFPLAEMAGEVLRLECVLYRREWLETRADRLGADYAGPMLEAGMRAYDRTTFRLEHIEKRFRSAWSIVAAGLDMPEVRAADAALDRTSTPQADAASPPPALSPTSRILCIVRPVAELSPGPRLIDGALRELVWTGDPRDLGALRQSMALKNTSGGRTTVDVLMPGGPEQEHLLYRLAGPADRLIRLDTVSASSASLADAVRVLEASARYDLIVTGASSLDGAPAPGPFLAGSLGRAYQVRECIDSVSEGIVGISLTSRPTRWDIGTLIAAQEKDIIVLASKRDDRSSAARFEPAAAAKTETLVVTSAAGAAEFLRSFASAMNAAKAPEYLETVNRGELPAGPAVWAVLDAADRAAGPSLLRTARMAADHAGKKACALIAAPDSMHAGLLGLARMNGADAAYCISTGAAALSPAGKRGILQMLMKAAGEALVIAGPGWDGTFGYAAGEPTVSAGVIAGATGIRADARGALTCLTQAYDGKLARVATIGSGTAFITVAPELDLPLPAARGFTATALPLRPEQSWLAPHPPEPALTLGRAEVIIDIGYGIRDKAGLELAQELKQALERMGLAPMFGATRKVTQDLKLLPLETQIGQTGVRVNPKVIICLGISGAPQHIDYLGMRSDVLCFNKDPEAPLMKLKQMRPAPRVHPIAGDLFVTVRELIEELK